MSDGEEGTMTLFGRLKARARKLLEDHEAMLDAVERARLKAERHAGPLEGVLDSIGVFIRLLRAWAAGRYRHVPTEAVVLVLAGLLYLLMPFDLIPDFILGFGLLDDVAVIGLVVKRISGELHRFRIWESEQGLVETPEYPALMTVDASDEPEGPAN